MKKIYFLLLLTELFIGAYAFAATSEIKLSGRKDRVLPSRMRAVVLDVAETYLNQEDEDFVASVAEIENPYAFESLAVASPGAVVIKDSEAVVVYDDVSILQVIGGSFAKQVRGTLARGENHYLQLQGGGMLKSGTSFPAKIPQVEGESFTVTITEVHSHGYTLTMGDAVLPVSFDAPSGDAAGATRDSAK